MNTHCHLVRQFVLAAILSFTFAALGQVPHIIQYQSRVAVGGVNFEGNGQFRFALVNTNGTTTFWSNDGTSTGGSQPTAAVTLPVTKGLYSVQLGDTTLANMTAIPASVFTNADVRLRVWFNDGVNGSQLLSPDHRIAAVGYAMVAGGLNLPATANSTTGVINQDGVSLMHTFGTQNVFVGQYAGNFGMTGSYNSAAGWGALYNNTTGRSNAAVGYTALNGNTTGDFNTANGTNALAYNSTGSNNTGSGYEALNANTVGLDNTGIGYKALIANTTGSSNIALGMNAGSALTTGSNNIAIGNSGVAGESNIIRIGNSQTDTFLTGIVHGNGSGLTGITVAAANLTGTISGAQIAPGAVGTTQLASGAVGAAQLADGSVTATKMTDGTISPEKLSKPVRTGSVSSSSLSMDPTGSSFTVPFNPAFGSVPNVTLTMDAAAGTAPSKAYLALTSRTASQFTAQVSNGTSAPLTAMSRISVSGELGGSNNYSLSVVNGNPAISFGLKSTGRLGYVRATDASGNAWGAPITVDNTVVGETSLAIVNGNPAIAYYDNSNSALKYVRATDPDGTTWGTPVTLDNGGNVGLRPSLAVVNGNPAIAYIFAQNPNSVIYIRATDPNGTSWGSTLSFLGANVSSSTLLVVNGNPAISFASDLTSMGQYVRATDANGTNWGVPVVVGKYVTGSMAIVNGNPAICGNSYYSRATDADGMNWGTPVPLLMNAASLAVANGCPAIFGDGGYIRSADANGAVWSDAIKVSSGDFSSALGSLALVNGQPAMVTTGGLFIRATSPLPFNILWMALEP